MADDPDDIVLQVLHIIDDAEERFLELAALLRRLKATQPQGFLAVIGLPKLGRRKAFYLIEIDEAFGGLPHLRPRLVSIGWSKLSQIAKHATPENVESLLQLAESHTEHELRLLLKGVAIKPGGRLVLLYLDPDQFGLFSKVLRQHGAKKGKKGLLDKEAALVLALSKLAEPKAPGKSRG
jgi:hypothetical protein